MTQSVRAFYRGIKGRAELNLDWAPITIDSAVAITAAEWLAPADPGYVLAEQRPHLGDATIWVSNVGPHGGPNEPGGVEFALQVDWGDPLDVMVTITVFDPVEQFIEL